MSEASREPGGACPAQEATLMVTTVADADADVTVRRE
jgi:hypothetical protein